MNSPKKHSSIILSQLRQKKNPLVTKRIRTSMILASRIAIALKERGWKKQDLALAINKKPSVITRWLSGTHNFTSDTLSDIQEVLGVKLLFLEDEKVEPVIIFPHTINIIVNVFNSVEYSEITGITMEGSYTGVQVLNTYLVADN